jgi:cell division septation protein DedD
MRGVFDDEGPAPAQELRDKELTLGSGSLVAMFFGLVLICGLFFGLGYAMGHRGSEESTDANQAPGGAPAVLQADGSRPKPSASAAGAVKPTSGAVADLSASAETETTSDPGTQSSAVAEATEQAGQSLVRPALPGTVIQTQGQQPTGAVAPAMNPIAAMPGALMVQIAAVTNPDDAGVLVNALRRRGYAVAARRDVADGMIHVRIGPFSSRDEAEKWRQKLLSDGYNAIVQP